jgi:hypothetical protein
VSDEIDEICESEQNKLQVGVALGNIITISISYLISFP